MNSVGLRTLCVTAFALPLLGCGQTHHAEQLCEGYIKKQLINPETAQFFEFKELSKQAWVDVSMSHWNYTGAEREQAIRNLEQMWDRTASGGTKVYTLRYKAQGRLGNTITNFSMCTAKKDACYCGMDDGDSAGLLSRS